MMWGENPSFWKLIFSDFFHVVFLYPSVGAFVSGQNQHHRGTCGGAIQPFFFRWVGKDGKVKVASWEEVGLHPSWLKIGFFVDYTP